MIEVTDKNIFVIARYNKYNLDEPVLEYMKVFGMPNKVEYSKNGELFECKLTYDNNIKKYIQELEDHNAILIAENEYLKKESKDELSELPVDSEQEETQFN